MNRKKMPTFIASPDALERRLILLPCGEKIAQPDRQHYNKLKAERSGILNRWIVALQRLRERGDFDLPETSMLEVTDYTSMQDSMTLFVSEWLIADADAETPIDELLNCYNSWARSKHLSEIGAITFGKRLKGAGIKQTTVHPITDGVRSTQRVYRVRLRRQDGKLEHPEY